MEPGRLLNRTQQGDIGEASAIQWLSTRGATILTPLGHSPNFDLAAEIDGRLLRFQVKTSTSLRSLPSGDRYEVAVATRGGNQSWSGFTTKLDPTRFDFLFVLVGDGRRWLIPAASVDGNVGIHLGGSKYSEYEIERGAPLTELVKEGTRLQSGAAPGEYRSGQPGETVNLVAYAFAGSNPASPIAAARPVEPSNRERRLGRSGQAVINQKRRLTIPQRAFFEAGFANEARVRVTSAGPGRILIEQIELPGWAQACDAA